MPSVTPQLLSSNLRMEPRNQQALLAMTSEAEATEAAAIQALEAEATEAKAFEATEAEVAKAF